MVVATTRTCSAPAEAVFSALAPMFGDRVTRGQAFRDQPSRDEGVPDRGVPDMAAFPLGNAVVAAIARVCTAHRRPIVPFGTDTSLESHVAAAQGGVLRESLNAALRSAGLFFPFDPGANASLGGMAATRASGTTAVRYGTRRENVLGLTVVTPDARVIRTGSRARKSASGLDLTCLYVGSEGALGLITEDQLKLYGLPEAIVAAVCQFPTLGAAMATVIAVLQAGIPMARIELADAMQMHMVIRYSGLDEFEEKPPLFLKFHPSPAGTQEQAGVVQDLAVGHGGSRFAVASRPEDRTRLWKARHTNYYANLPHPPNRRIMGTDTCVPRSALVECITETEADVVATGLLAPLIGHVGDGNFHLGILFDPADAGQRARAEGLARRVGERAIRRGGTCSGEHGIGLHKRGAGGAGTWGECGGHADHQACARTPRDHEPRQAAAGLTTDSNAEPARRSDDGLKSLTKLIRVLDSFSTTDRTLSLSEICQRTGYPKSTTHRLLASLREAGLLEQANDRDRYRLGLKLFELGNTVLANMDLHREARPYVDALGRLTAQAVHLAVFDGRNVVVVGRSDPEPGSGRAIFESAPAHCTSVGKAILAHLPAPALDRFIDMGLTRFTDTTITDPAALRAELATIEARGYAIDEGEHQPGLRCVGAPIRDLSGRVFAAVSVSGPAWKLPLDEVDRIAKIVIHNANGISRALGHKM